MNIPPKYQGRYFYHFTHIDNIESIVEQGGLLSTNEKNKRGIEHHNIANINIQIRRRAMAVPIGPKGCVHDYVPFYFTSINPMLLGLLNRKVIDQPYICFLAVSIEKLLEENVVFTDASANTDVPPNFYNTPDYLDRLNWGLIDSRKWGESNDQDRHARMAEVLVYKKVPLDWIESYIVFNDIGKQKIQECYENMGLAKPVISYDWFNRTPFYYTKFAFSGRKYETLVTGPIQLYQQYENLLRSIIDNRSNHIPENPLFHNIEDALSNIKSDFCILPELDGIYQLETDNKVHHETVSDHTLRVVRMLERSNFFGQLGKKSKNIVRLCAYLHDIGKGPKEKWSDGIQKVYPDHPADAIPMLERILSEEFAVLSEKEIQRICLLIVYHDLMGDIIYKERSKQELINLNLSKKELIMLAAITEADIGAICEAWTWELAEKLDSLIDQVLEEEQD